jgi:integrase/recombinase XerD
MKKHPENIRIKREYFAFLKEAKRNGEQSVDAAAQALDRFEAYARKPFKSFHVQQAIGFKAHLAKQINPRTRRPLSNATVHATLAALKAFFVWLAGQPGYKSRMTYSAAEYFNLSAKDMAIAKAGGKLPVPTIEQIRHALSIMRQDSDIERRNRALIAFALLTGARDNAIASMLLKHVDLDQRRIYQDAREVRTKFAKSFPTFFFPVGEDIEQILVDWVHFLKVDRLWGLSDPLFPKTLMGLNSARHFEAEGLSRECWSNATRIRKIFQEAFVSTDLPYFNPHSFRKTLARLGEKVCQSPEAFKAWSQNLGHEKVLTTFTSYGPVGVERQAELIQATGRQSQGEADIAAILRNLADDHERATKNRPVCPGPPGDDLKVKA